MPLPSLAAARARRLTSAALAVVASPLLVACGAPAAAPPTVHVAVPLPAREHRLPNGLEVVILEDHGAPEVAVSLRYHVGGKDDPAGRSGFAHLFEHLMFGGSRNVKEGEHTERLHAVGARNVNAWTGRDATEYYEVVPSAALDLALWLESDRMATLKGRLDEGAFRREREVVKNEWRERYDDAPCGHVRGFVTAAIYPAGHPYHRLPIGSPAELDAATLDDVRAFHRRHYAPNNATLVLTGRVDAARALAAVARHFGAIPPSGELVVPHRAPPVRLDRERRLAVEASVERPRVVIGWPVPPPHAPGWHEVELIRRELPSWVSHFAKAKDEIADEVTAEVHEGRLGSTFLLTVVLKPGASLDQAVDDVDLALRDFAKLGRNAGWSWDGFADDRIQPMVARIFDLEESAARASTLQDYKAFFGRVDVAQHELRAMQSVSVADVTDALDHFFRDPGRVVAQVTPKAGAPIGGRLVGSR